MLNEMGGSQIGEEKEAYSPVNSCRSELMCHIHVRC